MILSQPVQPSQAPLVQAKVELQNAPLVAENTPFLKAWPEKTSATEFLEFTVDTEEDTKQPSDDSSYSDSNPELENERYSEIEEGQRLEDDTIQAEDLHQIHPALGAAPTVNVFRAEMMNGKMQSLNGGMQPAEGNLVQAQEPASDPDLDVSSIDDSPLEKTRLEHAPNPSLHTAEGSQNTNGRPLADQASQIEKTANKATDTALNTPTTAEATTPTELPLGMARESVSGRPIPQLHQFDNGAKIQSKNNKLPEDASLGSLRSTVDRASLQTPQSANVEIQTAQTPAPSAAQTASNPNYMPAQTLESLGMEFMEQDTKSPLSDEPVAESGVPTLTTTSQTSSGLIATNIVKSTAPTVVQQIAAALEQSSGQSTQISLNPEELGRVRISLSSGEAGLVVNIVAERPETADLMRRNIDSLLQDFSELGYDNPTFDFQNDGDRDETNSKDGQSDSPDGQSIEVTLNQPQMGMLRHTVLGGLDLKL